jgi:hypothetical protein
MTADPGRQQAVPPDVLELYKLAVDQADHVSSRRASANTYFLTIQTGLAAVCGLLASAAETTESDVPKVDDVALFATALVGVILSMTWWLLLRSYRALNSAKFKVITEIETNYFPLQLFNREWQILKATEGLPWWKTRYAELGFIERTVPALFLAVYVALGLRVMLS